MSTTTSELTDPVTGRVVGINAFKVENHPATGAQATVTQAAGGAGVRNVCKSITATVACGANAQTPLVIVLRDGASGVGTVIWSSSLAAPVNGVGVVAITGLDIPGSPATAMTLEFTGSGVAASQQTVAMNGYLAQQ